MSYPGFLVSAPLLHHSDNKLWSWGMESSERVQREFREDSGRIQGGFREGLVRFPRCLSIIPIISLLFHLCSLIFFVILSEALRSRKLLLLISYALLRAWNVVGFELTVIVVLVAIDKPIKQCVE